MFEILQNGNKLISPNTTQNPTRLWRSLKEDAVSSKVQYNIDLKSKNLTKQRLNLEVHLHSNRGTLKQTVIILHTED